MLGQVLSLCPSSHFRSNSHLVLWDLKQCFQGDLENGNNMEAPYSGRFFLSTMYCLVTWETEESGGDVLKESTVDAAIIMF